MATTAIDHLLEAERLLAEVKQMYQRLHDCPGAWVEAHDIAYAESLIHLAEVHAEMFKALRG